MKCVNKSEDFLELKQAVQKVQCALKGRDDDDVKRAGMSATSSTSVLNNRPTIK